MSKQLDKAEAEIERLTAWVNDAQQVALIREKQLERLLKELHICHKIAGCEPGNCRANGAYCPANPLAGEGE